MASRISTGKRISSVALIAASGMFLVSCTAMAPESPKGVEQSATNASEKPPILNSVKESCDATEERINLVTAFIGGNIGEGEMLRIKAGKKIIEVGIEIQGEYSREKKLTETIHSLGESAVAFGEVLSLNGTFLSISDKLIQVADDYDLEVIELQSRCEALLD